MQAIPTSWVDRIFERMHGNYGSLWSDRWRSGEIRNGIDVGVINAKATWLEALSSMSDAEQRIRHALEICKQKLLPPTLPEFLDFCRQAQIEKPVLLPPIDKNAAEKIAKMTTEAFRKEPENDYLRWAKRPILSPSAERSLMDCVEMGDHRFFDIFLNRFEKGWVHGDRAEKLGRMLRKQLAMAA